MKHFALALTAILASSAMALAGDGKEVLPTTPLPLPACDYSWTGFYIGGHVGYGWSTGDTSFEGLPTPAAFGALDTQSLHPEANGTFAGGQLGFNYQFSKIVIGAETDFSGSDFDGTRHRSPIPQFGGGTTPGELTAHENTDWFGTFRGRLGFVPMCRLLCYGTGGVAYGHTQYFGNTAFPGVPGIQYPRDVDDTNVGWTVGGGLEYAIGQHWSVKAEYLYLDFGSKGFTGEPIPANPPFAVHYHAQTQEHTASFGVNYKF
jgi:outer membrane immunogenic protein